MKTRLFSLYSIFILSLGTAVAIFYSTNQWLAIDFVIGAFIISGLILYNWLYFVKELTLKSNQILNKKEDVTIQWSFHNVDLLKQNQEQIKKKFQISAELISNLSHPDKLNAIHDLDENDPISEALHNIKKAMQQIKEDDEKRTWIANGLAMFGEVLRNKMEVKEYGYQIISNLVKYIQANQGAIFIEYEETERYLELVACYAYEKRKHSEKRILEGQGILGQCMLEKEFIFIKDVPQNFIKISSGLGEALPRNIIIAPLIFNEVFCGVIELASFNSFQQHQIEFLKNVCKTIASEIAVSKKNEHTNELLEESNVLTQELQTREEEMKQSLEELAATQEEMARKQVELSGIINAIDSTLATAEFDLHGDLIRHNHNLEQFLGLTAQYLQGKDYRRIMGETANEIIWKKILDGEITSGDFKTSSNAGYDLWLSITFTRITNLRNESDKILCMIQNITEKKLKENEFERLSLVANNTDNSVIITDKSGLIEYVNAGFIKLTGYQPSEVMGKKPGKILQGVHTDNKVIQKLRSQLSEGIPIYEEILNYNKKGESYWVSLAINPVRDQDGTITKFISIQANITQTKIRALDFHQKMEALSRSNSIIEIDMGGFIIDINDNYLQLLQYQRDEVIGKPYSLLTRKEIVFNKLMQTIQEKGMQSGEFYRYDKFGNRHCMKLMDYPVLNLNHEIEKIIEFGVDISNEKRLEKETEYKEAELKSYLDGINNTIASAEFSMEGVFKDANEIFLKVMGFSKNELNDKSFEFLMGDDPSVIMIWEVLSLGKFFSGEFKMKNKAGKELWLTGTFNPIIIEGNQPKKIMMFAQFTTQEKEKLSELTAMVQALKSALPVLEFNTDFVCKTANDKALKMFGVTRLDLRSKTLLDFIPTNYHITWLKNRHKVLTSEVENFIIPFLIGSEIKNYEISVSLVRTLNGEVGKVIILLVKEVLDRVSVLTAN